MVQRSTAYVTPANGLAPQSALLLCLLLSDVRPRAPTATGEHRGREPCRVRLCAYGGIGRSLRIGHAAVWADVTVENLG